MGHWITRARLRGQPIGLPLLSGYFLSAFLRGIYDFLVLINPVFALPIAAALIVAIWIWRLILLRRLHQDATRQTNLQSR